MDEYKGLINLNIYNEESGSKTVNEVGTMLIDFFNKKVHGDEDIVFFMDNCQGQNKNNYLMKFFSKLVEKCNSIRLLFLTPGHSHFSCDRSFGSISNKLNKCKLFNSKDVYNNLVNMDGIENLSLYTQFYDIRNFTIKYGIKNMNNIS